MNNIIKYALGANADKPSADVLLEIFSNTPNAEYAAELFLGIADTRELDDFSTKTCSKGIEYDVFEVDNWNKRVTCKQFGDVTRYAQAEDTEKKSTRSYKSDDTWFPFIARIETITPSVILSFKQYDELTPR